MPTYEETLDKLFKEQGIDTTIEELRNPKPYTNPQDIGTYATAFGIGATDMANSMSLGGIGQILGTLGDLTERVSPWSGEGINETDRQGLRSIGLTDSQIDQKFPRRDSWLTQGAKSVLQQGVENQDAIRQWELETLGDNPDIWARGIRGAGTTGAFMGGGALAQLLGGGPLAAAAAMGATESLAESGGTMLDAFREGRYDDGGLAAANKVFAANLPLNILLEKGLGRFSNAAGKIENPLARYLYKGGTEVLNEVLQEPSQNVISDAAMNSLRNNTGFMGELWEGAKQWPETFMQVAPETALSTLLTHAALGLMPAGMPGSVRNEFRYNRQLAQGQQQAPQVKADVDNFINGIPNNPAVSYSEEQADELSKLQGGADKINQNLNTIGYNDYGGLMTNLQNLEGIRQTIDMYKGRQAILNAAQQARSEQTAVKGQKDAFNKGSNINTQTVPQNVQEKPSVTPVSESPLAQTPDIVKDAENNKTNIRTSAGTRADVRYRAVEADSLVTSHNDNGSLNSAYDQRLQGRRRDSQASQLQISRIANAPDPVLLTQNPLASDGAPVIDSNGVVISGNGRTLGLRKAYKQGTANDYRAYITEHAAEMGLDPEYISKMKNPVIVREITSEIKDMAKFASEANEGSVSQMSATDRAISNAGLITEEDLMDYDFDKKLEANKKFVAQVIAKMPKADQASLLQSNGVPSAEGVSRVRQALTAKAYNDPSILDRLTEFTDDDIANVSNGLEAAAPQMAKFENSNIRPELSLSKDIMQAVETLGGLKKRGESVESYLSSGDLFSGGETDENITGEAKKLLEFFGTKKQNGRYRTAKQLARGLTEYAKQAMSEVQNGQGTISEDAVRSKAQILDQVLNDIYAKEAANVEDYATKISPDKNNRKQGKLTEEDLRNTAERQLLSVGRSEDEARAVSEIYIAGMKTLARAGGISLEDAVKADGLHFEYHNTLPVKDKNGRILQHDKANISFEDGETIIRISKLADESSIVHELGHLFLNKIKNFALNGQLRGVLKKDFDTLLKTYKVTMDDFVNKTDAYINAQEKFATDFERYLRKGQAPNAGLKHAFELFKKWLHSIYETAKQLTYTGADGKKHELYLNKEVRKVFDHLLGGGTSTEKNSLHQILGEKGASAIDKTKKNGKLMDNLKVAKEMTEAGKDTKTIRLATGWEKSPDGKWRYEINDNNLRLDNVEKAINRAKNGKGHPGILPDFYRNKKLFDAYPELKSMRVEFVNFDDGTIGEYDPDDNIIRLNTDDKYRDEIRSTILHEVQHAIQDIEGFAPGGDPEQFEARSVKSLNDELQKLENEAHGNTDEKRGKEIQKRISQVKEALDFASEEGIDSIVETDDYYYTDADEAYKNLGGEVEAYNVEKRINMTAKERRNTPLADTQSTQDWDNSGGELSTKSRTADKKTEIFHQVDSEKQLQEEVKKLTTPQSIQQWFKDYFSGEYDTRKVNSKREKYVRENLDKIRQQLISKYDPGESKIPVKEQKTPESKQDSKPKPAEQNNPKQEQLNKPKQEQGQRLNNPEQTDAKMPENKQDENKGKFSMSEDLDDFSFGQGDKQVEKRYQKSVPGVQKPSIVKRFKRTVRDILHGFKGSNADLHGKDANGVNLWPAKTMLDQLNRDQQKAANDTMEALIQTVKGLDEKQRDLFMRKRLVDDLKWRIDDFEKKGKEAPELPYSWSRDVFEADYEKITRIAEDEKYKAVMDAVRAEEKAQQDLAEEFINNAKQLGIDISGRFPNKHYFRHVILEYAEAVSDRVNGGLTVRDAEVRDFTKMSMKSILNRAYMKKYKGSPLDISANYFQAMGETRVQMAIDNETMKTLIKLKNEYDITPQIIEARDKFNEAVKNAQNDGKTLHQAAEEAWSKAFHDLIPEGYSMFSPAGSGLIANANTVAESTFAHVFNELADKENVPIDEILNAASLLDKDLSKEMIVMPTKVVDALKNLARRRNKTESRLGRAARQVTSLWKADVLYNPLRNIKYNIRNFTGDMDAFIAGIGFDGFKYIPQAVKELSAHFKGNETTAELQDYIDRAGGRLKIQGVLFDESQVKGPLKYLKEIDKDDRFYKKAAFGAWNIGIKLMNKEVRVTEYRENLLRYAAYLYFKNDMDKNNGVPTRWGASNKDEIMSIDGIEARAYEMSNDLLGAYDKISDTGKELRTLLMPFWSWQEVNMKRYWRLLKNGFNGDNAGDFTKRLLVAKMVKLPVHAINITSAGVKIMLLTAMMQAWNRFVVPDNDDELSEDTQYTPHITLFKMGGKVYYFNRIGSLADALDWFNLDTIFLDAKELANGQQSLTGWLKKVWQAPVNKGIGQLNPYLKMPIELATGRSLYPNAFHSRTITDSWEHVMRSVGFEYPYKLVTNKTRSDVDELIKILAYSVDPEEAAYFNALDKVRQFNERVLDKHFDGFASTKRGTALRNLKTAMRYKDNKAIRRYLKEYRELDGTPQGLKQSMKAMNPLFGLSKDEQKQFLKWLTPKDRKVLKIADRYWRKLAVKYIR